MRSAPGSSTIVPPSRTGTSWPSTDCTCWRPLAPRSTWRASTVAPRDLPPVMRRSGRARHATSCLSAFAADVVLAPQHDDALVHRARGRRGASSYLESLGRDDLVIELGLYGAPADAVRPHRRPPRGVRGHPPAPPPVRGRRRAEVPRRPGVRHGSCCARRRHGRTSSEASSSAVSRITAYDCGAVTGRRTETDPARVRRHRAGASARSIDDLAPYIRPPRSGVGVRPDLAHDGPVASPRPACNAGLAPVGTPGTTQVEQAH